MISKVFQQATLIDRKSPFNNKKVDVWVEGGKIKKIETSIEITDDSVEKVDMAGQYMSLGFSDLRCLLQSPGYEYKNTQEQLCASATNGGFTRVAVQSGTNPPIQTALQVQQIKSSNFGYPVEIKPFAVLSKDQAKTEMVEYRELLDSGAVGFFDHFKNQPDFDLVKGRLNI
jgi:dihydroorotase